MSHWQNSHDGGTPLTLRWVFVRGDDRIDVCRSVAPTSVQVTVSDGAVIRPFTFGDRSALIAFHAGFEQALTQTGWRLAAFEPERRRGSDRRTLARGTERRGAIELVWSR